MIYNSSRVTAELGSDTYAIYSGITGAHGHGMVGTKTFEGHSDAETFIEIGECTV